MENRGCFSTWQKYTISIPGTILVALKAAGFKGLIACRRQQDEDVFTEVEFTPVAGRDSAPNPEQREVYQKSGINTSKLPISKVIV